MKKFYFLPIIGCCIIFFPSCSKDAANKTAVVAPSSTSTDVAIAVGQTYLLNLAGATNASIYRQATHYQTSETVSDPQSGSFAYKYQPDAGFIGKDQVMLVTILPTPTAGVRTECLGTNGLVNTSVTPTFTTSYQTINITVGK